MDEEVAESWEEAADSGVNNERLQFKANILLVASLYFTGLLLEVLIALFHVSDSHGPTMWLKLALASRNLAS